MQLVYSGLTSPPLCYLGGEDDTNMLIYNWATNICFNIELNQPTGQVLKHNHHTGHTDSPKACSCSPMHLSNVLALVSIATDHVISSRRLSCLPVRCRSECL